MIVNDACESSYRQRTHRASLGATKTKREAVRAALAEYVARRKRLEILSMFGTVDFDPKYDYKAERKKVRVSEKKAP